MFSYTTIWLLLLGLIFTMYAKKRGILFKDSWLVFLIFIVKIAVAFYYYKYYNNYKDILDIVFNLLVIFIVMFFELILWINKYLKKLKTNK